MQSNLFLLTAPDVCGWGIAEGSFFIIGRKIVFIRLKLLAMVVQSVFLLYLKTHLVSFG